MASTIVVPDRQIVGANLQQLCNVVSDEFAHAQADINALQTGADAGSGPVRYVRAASTANIADLTQCSTTMDTSVTLVAGDRVLLKDQSTGSQNGVYVVGTVAAGKAPLTRALDFDAAAEVQSGSLLIPSEGTANAGLVFELTGAGPFVVGTDTLTIGAITTATAASASPQDVGTGAAAVGVATKYAREDHAHHIPAATTVAPGAMPFADKAFLDAIRADFGTAIADADATIQIAQGQVRDCPTLTGNHVCTLGVTGCTGGEYLIIRRSSIGAFTLTIKNDAAATLAVFAASKPGGGIFRYSASTGHFELLIAGQLG